MTKTSLCDICLLEDKVTIAKYSGQTVIRGSRIGICTSHKSKARVIQNDSTKVLSLIDDARNKAFALRV